MDFKIEKSNSDDELNRGKRRKRWKEGVVRGRGWRYKTASPQMWSDGDFCKDVARSCFMVTSLIKLSKGNNFLAKCLTMCRDSD